MCLNINNDFFYNACYIFFNNTMLCVLTIFKIAIRLKRDIIIRDDRSIGHVNTAAAEYHVPRKIDTRL